MNDTITIFYLLLNFARQRFTINKILRYCCFVIILLTVGETKSLGLDLPDLPNKPVDFWGIYWGDSPDKLGNGKVLFRKNPELQGEVYDTKDNNINFEGFQISQVRYVFYYKKLTDVMITINDKNIDDIYMRTKKIFGDKFLPSSTGSLTEFIWMDEELRIVLAISTKSSSTLRFTNMKLLEEMFPQLKFD